MGTIVVPLDPDESLKSHRILKLIHSTVLKFIKSYQNLQKSIKLTAIHKDASVTTVICQRNCFLEKEVYLSLNGF